MENEQTKTRRQQQSVFEYRLGQLEAETKDLRRELDSALTTLTTKFDSSIRELGAKVDDIRTAMLQLTARETCPKPGLCVQLQQEAVEREKRLRSLENDKNTAKGALLGAKVLWAIIWSVAGSIGALLIKHFLP